MIDVGKLTTEETQDLLAQCIAALSWEALAATLNTILTTEQKEELGETWFNIDREGF